jgi:hypothetical protein
MTTKDIDSLVADNRRQIRDEFGRFIQVDEGRTRDLKFGVSYIEVSAEATVDTRSTGDQIVFGHNDPDKGFGRGTFGDDKGAWEARGREESVDYGDTIAFGIWSADNSFGIGTFGDDKSDFEVTNTAQQSAVVTRTGRRVIAELISGVENGITTIAYGDDGTDAELSDDSLGNRIASTGVTSRLKPKLNKSHVRGVFASTEFLPDEDDVFEISAESQGGGLMARATVDVEVDSDTEVRAGVIVTFEGDGVGNSVVTNAGEAAFADAVQVPGNTVEFATWAFGRSGGDEDATMTSLYDQVFTVDATAESDRDRAIIMGDVPSNAAPANERPFDVGQVGIIDDSGRLVWVSPTQEFVFGDDTKFNVESFFKIA